MGLGLFMGIVLLIIGIVWWFRYPELRWPYMRKGWLFGLPRVGVSAVSLIGAGMLALVLVLIARLTG